MPSDLEKRIADRIVSARKKKGMTQRQVADALRISEGQYAHYEKCRAQPGINTIYDLCSLFDESFDDWLNLKKAKEKASTPEESEIEASAEERKFTPREIEVYNILEETFVRLGLIEPGGDLTSNQTDAMIALIKIIKLAFNPGNKKID